MHNFNFSIFFTTGEKVKILS